MTDRARDRRRLRPSAIVGGLPLIILVVVLNLPLLNAVLVSLKPDSSLADPLSLGWPPTIEHYRAVLGSAGYDFPRYFGNSAMISLGAVALVLVITVPACYAAIRLRFAYRFLVPGPITLRLLPAMFFALPMYLMFAAVGLLDTVFGLIIANALLNVPLAIVLLSTGIEGMPRELEEAAAVDGATVLRTLLAIVIPTVRPSIISTAVLVFMFSWNEYLFGVTLGSTNATPVTVGAANFVTSYGIEWGNLSAVTVLASLVPLLFAAFAQRYLVDGMSAGALKG